ncbi:RNA ligase family protein [Nocardia cyriacigeorgica]|uniref:RNA ligase family protein n=1 Tax=Nocardia cyriacigeorgica TaxID=135487 RepID=UPI002458651C|nr:RNA ligase family protein [Nocardia cyriacigeorgica]
MKFDTPKNNNYAAVITSVKAVVTLPNRDRIVAVPLFGHQAIVQKGWEPGDLGVFIPAEAQLSHEYASVNNMYRHGHLNADPGVTGYLEDNRRVKAIKLGGHRSNALFMPLSSLEFTGVNIGELKEGDTFDTINGHEIVRKYEVRPAKEASTKGNQPPKVRRVEERMFPQHIDTDNYWRNEHKIESAEYITVTQKLHGTSIRVGNTMVSRKLSWRERIARKLGATVQELRYENVYGSRRVIKDANDPDQVHFYDQDIWTIEGRKLDGVIPEGYAVYGELVGWTPSGEPIQKGYTYRIPKGEARLFVYRVTVINPQGITVDLGWPQVEEFCRNLGLRTVPVLWEGYKHDFNVDDWMNIRYADLAPWNSAPAVPLDDNGTVDEGVVVRAEGLTPRLLKAKSPEFLEHETKMLDAEVVDLESVGAAD